MITRAAIAIIKVTLDHVEPPVMRRLVVPISIKMHRLHTMLQIAIGWTDSHLYEFYVGGARFGIPDADWGSAVSDARKVSFKAVLEDTGAKSFKYLYDFGDGWEHTVKIVRIEPMIEGLTYPFLVQASGRCPPEDVGGPFGYEEFRSALADPKHQRHEEFKEWWGSQTFDAQDVDTRHIDSQFEILAAKAAKKSRPKV